MVSSHFFYSENGGSMFLRNAGMHLPDRRRHSSQHSNHNVTKYYIGSGAWQGCCKRSTEQSGLYNAENFLNTRATISFSEKGSNT
jgi:hypothetical protein